MTALDPPPNRPMEAFRSHLLHLARVQIDPGRGHRIDPSDVVHQTILDAEREAVMLHHLQGHPQAETARRLGRTDAATAGLLHRGLKRLRVLLTPGG